MAVTIRSAFAVGKLLAPVIGGAIRLIGGKKAGKAAKATEVILATHPKSAVGGVTFGLVVAFRAACPEQANIAIDWLLVALPKATKVACEVLEALKATG